MKQISILLCFVTCIVYGQDCRYSLKGSVKDFHDGSIIQDVTLYIEQLNKYTTTNIKGEFSFADICSGSIVLVVSHVNCETKTINITIDGDIEKDITLEHHVEELNEVTVSGASNKETSTAQESLIKSDAIEDFSSASLGDVLKTVSGVSSINTGSTIVKPVINGLHSSRVIIMNNGVRLQDQEWGIEHAPNIDINGAGEISVIKGSGALAYGGDAIGGVVVVKPSRYISADTLYGRTIVGGQTNGRGYNVSSTLNRNYNSGWFAQIQGTYKRNGDFKAPDYNLTNTGLDSKSISGRFGKRDFESGFEVYYSYLDNEIGILGASHVGSIFDLERAINSGQPNLIEDFSYDINAPKQEVTHQMAKASYFKRFQNFGKVNLQYDYQHNQRFEFDVRIGDRRDIPAIDLTLQTHTISADVNLDANLNRKIDFGIIGRFQDNFANPATGVRRLIPDYEKYDFGAYITVDWQVSDETIFDAGIRYDFNRIDAKKFYLKSRWDERGYDDDFSDIIIEELATQFLTNPVFDYHNISASVGLKYDINDTSQIIGNYNLASRPPNVSELFSDGLHHSAARFEIGDIRFDKEIANRFSASYVYKAQKLNLLAEVFYNRIKDFIYLRPFDFINTIRGPFPLWEYQQTNAELYGIDFTATYELTNKFQLENKTAFIRGTDLEANSPLIDIPAFNTTNKIRYTNETWHNFSASLKSEWVFVQNKYPNFNFEVTNQLTNESILIDISTPPPAYHLLHFSSEATFALSKATNLNITLGVNNLFNTSYRNYLNRLRFFADDVGRNITLQLQLNY